jgi:DnaJ-class molecular chaperone
MISSVNLVIFSAVPLVGGGLEAEEVNAEPKSNLRIKVKLTLEEVANGVEKKVK